MKISAVIFDLNGTILEDEDEYGRAYNKVLKSLGVETKDETPQVKGIGVKENWPVLIKRFGIKTNKSFDQLAHETQEAYLLEIDSITIREGFDDFIEKLKDSGIEVALATSNTWETVEKVLNKVGLQGIFETITTIDEVVYGKPDPSLFTVTADKLGIEREECLVIEDAPSGITAASLAGMKVIAITDEDEDEEILSKANLIVDSFSEITPKVIEGL